MYTVYIRADDVGRVEEAASSAFLADFTGWTAVCTGEGDRFIHAQGGFFGKPVRDERGLCRYRMVPESACPPDAYEVIAAFDKEGVRHVLYERPGRELDEEYVPSPAAQSGEQRMAALEAELRAAKILLGLEE